MTPDLNFPPSKHIALIKLSSKFQKNKVAVDTLDLLNFDLPCKTSPTRCFRGSPGGIYNIYHHNIYIYFFLI